MPPRNRVKKLDPEEQKSQFEAWKGSDEYKKMEKISERLKGRENITSTTPDLPGPWQDLLDMIWDLIKAFKVKTGKLKELPQPTVRSLFFAKENQTNEIVIIDGIDCGVEREYANTADKLRHKLTEIMDFCKDKLDMLKPEDYQNEKKTVLKSMQEFIKFYAPHMKSGHKIIYEGKMALVLRPLQELININYSYRSFQMGFIKEVDKEIRDFKVRALKRKYIIALQEVMRILFVESEGGPKLTCTPDIRKTFNKLEYKNWKDNPLEKMYLEPLHTNFKKLQKTLWRMWYDKVNFWKIPLFKNEELVNDIQTLIKSDMIAERLLGTQIRRDQINFIYSVISIIEKSDQKVREHLLRKDERTLRQSIPKLVVFKAVQRIRKWKDQKEQDEVKQKELDMRISELQEKKLEQEKNSPLKLANRSFVQTTIALDKTQDMNRTQSPKKTNPSPKVTQKKDQKSVEFEEAKTQEQKEFEKLEEKYGRYWLFDVLMENSKKQVFEQCAEFIRHINQAVQQDIEDKIIRIGITPMKTKNNQELLKQANDYLAAKSEKDNANKFAKATRPPELWNYPKILDKHEFRTIAEPKDCYIDYRIEHFEDKIDELAKHLDTYSEFYWKHMVDRVIDVFLGQYQDEPKDLPISEFQFDAEKRVYEEEK